MEIIKSSANLSLTDSYNLTRNPNTERMSDHVGETIGVSKFMVRREERGDTGEIVQIVSIVDDETGLIVSTNSPTFNREFLFLLDMVAAAGAEIHHIRVGTGTSKKGREYVTCVFVD